MQKLIDLFVKAIETHDAESLPMAAHYRATENSVPSALRHMETFNCFDKVNCIGTTLEDEAANTFFVALNVAYGSHEAAVLARVKLEGNLMSEVEIEVYRARANTGFWFTPHDMFDLKPLFDKEVDKDKQISREELSYIGHCVLDNSYDGSKYGREETCMLMEAGGIVYENSGYAKLINPHVKDAFPEKDIRVPIPIGIAPNRPHGENIRILAIDEKRGLVASAFDVDGVVSPYLVSDETSTCFVPESMLEGHHMSLLPEFFEGKSASYEMRATGATINIVKMSGMNVAALMQYTNMRPYGARTSWRKETTDGLKY